MVKLAEEAAKQGVLIMMAMHRLTPEGWPGAGLWYDSQVTEARVLESWTRLARALCKQWNVFAVDLMNEPHEASWGKGYDDKSDWGHAAERIGNHVLKQCPRWLIMVEGVGYSPGAPGMDDSSQGIWWGENLKGAETQPVRLTDPTKLVYSPHTYGPGTFMQSYFQSWEFPNNMAAIWDSRFGFLAKQHTAPVVMGELGGFYNGKDRQWQDAAIAYLVERGIGLFYFCIQPTSSDTGGILKDDWTTPQEEKLKLLSALPSTDVAALVGLTVEADEA